VSSKVDSSTGIAVITLNNPPVNSISEELLLGLVEQVKGKVIILPKKSFRRSCARFYCELAN
jgi:hypothetical protein